MRSRRIAVLLALFGSSWLAHSVYAGNIGYKLNGGSQQTVAVSGSAPYTNVIIDVGDLNGNSDLHIYDITSGGDAIDSVGMITIRGRQLCSGCPLLVAVATSGLSSVGAAFSNPGTPVSPGMRDVGGVEFVPDALHPTDTSLLYNSALSLNVRGDVTGNVTAGTLFRVTALRADSDPNPANHFGGTISGTLHATRGDGRVVGSTAAIAVGYVEAGWQISGDVVADGERDGNGDPVFSRGDTSTWGSVGPVLIGPSVNAPGLQGNISCEYGAITEIVSSGPIGIGPAAVNRSSIRTGLSMPRISLRAFDTTGDSNVLDRDVYADIETSARGPALLYPNRSSSFALIETEGDFVGTIHLSDFFGLNAVNGSSGNLRDSERRGIFIGGDFIGDITVDYSYQYGDIIARSFRPDDTLGFTGSITIGQMLKGGIVAVGTQGSSDPLDGTIGSIDIGHAESLDDAPSTNGRGFCGAYDNVIPPPFEGTDRDAWYTADAEDIYTIGGVIRAAKSIGSVSIVSLSDRLPELVSPGPKLSRPRIESPIIDDLDIGFMDHGCVWSGKLNSTTSTVTNDIADDYSSIGTLVIGCVGPRADIWVEDTELVDIRGDMFGEIHVASLEADQTIRIGGLLGDLDQASSDVAMCQSDPYDGTPSIDPVYPLEDSPRGI